MSEAALIEINRTTETDYKIIKYNLPTTDFDEKVNILASPFSAI